MRTIQSSFDFHLRTPRARAHFFAWHVLYIGADLDAKSLARVLQGLLAMSGSKSASGAPTGVEVTRRQAGEKEWVFVLNHGSGRTQGNVAGKV